MPAERKWDTSFDPTRFVLRESFKKRPALKAVKDYGTPSNAEIIAGDIANDNFAVLGTNMTTALCTFSAGGGITLTTAGASADSAIVLPHLNTNMTPWAVANQWGSSKSPRWETTITTGASIALTSIWAGLKLTNTPVIATDNDQVYFRYDSAENSGKWQLIHSRSDVDVTTVSSVTVAASTLYRLVIEVESDRTFMAYINGAAVGSIPFAALTASIDLKPYAGVLANTAAAKAIDVKYIECSKLAA